MNLIELDNITFSYEDDDRPVLQKFSLSVKSGTCLVVEGDNGSGKTTLFRILNGLSFPQEGKYFYKEVEINNTYLKDNGNAKAFHKSLGYLFQNPDVMLFNARVFDEVAFGPRQMGLNDDDVENRVEDILELFEIKGLADKAPYHLSGGQKKKVALAAVMALNPDVIILDEPDAGLDRKSIEWLTEFLIELKKAGKTLIIATHNPSVAEAVADEKLTL